MNQGSLRRFSRMMAGDYKEQYSIPEDELRIRQEEEQRWCILKLTMNYP
jgi:hypothetical protein